MEQRAPLGVSYLSVNTSQHKPSEIARLHAVVVNTGGLTEDNIRNFRIYQLLRTDMFKN